MLGSNYIFFIYNTPGVVGNSGSKLVKELAVLYKLVEPHFGEVLLVEFDVLAYELFVGSNNLAVMHLLDLENFEESGLRGRCVGHECFF